MELYRKIYEDILKWKNTSNGTSALMIEGARRVGKSTIVEKFAKENYKSYILIDFRIASKIIKDSFINDLNPKRINYFFQTLSIEYDVELFERNSLIIFDEVQRFPKAREAIKDLVKDGRYDYIETGSLISIKENVENITIPSEEEKIKMYPLDYEEFLYALGEKQLCMHIKDCYKNNKALQDEFHKRAKNTFKEYVIVGGMPQSVVAYIESNKNFNAADIKKREIIDLYRDDIKKADRKYRLKVSRIFENIPGFLSKHDKKIVLSEIDDNKQFSDYADAFYWLEDSMICNLCYKCNDPNIGFSLTKDESLIKCYMGDTGLLITMSLSENKETPNELYKKILYDNLSINEGMFFENAIAQILKATNRDLYFYSHYSKELHRSDIEIDFLISTGNKINYRVNPIEVKSAEKYKTVSYDLFKERFKERIGQGYIVHPKQYKKEDKKNYIPDYMFFSVVE